MSEFTSNKHERLRQLKELFYSVMEKQDPVNAVRRSQQAIDQSTPSDVIDLVDELVREGVPMIDLKTGINKFLNLLGKRLKSLPELKPEAGTFLYCCFRNNAELDWRLKAFRPRIRQLNERSGDAKLRMEVRSQLTELLEYGRYYEIKENILFPLLEKNWSNFRCLGVMWSFHDDIRRNLRALAEAVGSERFDIREFNRLIGDVYFNMYAIRFREEKILFPYVVETLGENALEPLFREALEEGFPYYTPEGAPGGSQRLRPSSDGKTDLGTGQLSAEQIMLIFNHLPVDITYVDENNKVKYFSTPARRIFKRSGAIIGRDVRNCHPPESVHVVERIVEAFRDGSQDHASFWISIKGEMILIQYFAVRDSAGAYRGVIEVSQEISGIRALKGERRLLDW